MFYAYPEDQDLGRELHGQRLPRRPRRDHLPLLLGVADRRDPARRHRRRDRGGRRSTCSSTCASTIRSARCRCTASAASGARCRSGCSPAGSTARPARSRPDNSAPLTGLFYGGGFTVLDGADDRQRRDRHRRRSAIVAGDDLRHQRVRRPARVDGGRAPGSRPARARHPGLPGVRAAHLGDAARARRRSPSRPTRPGESRSSRRADPLHGLARRSARPHYAAGRIASFWRPASRAQSFGTRTVLLIISDPDSAQSSTSGCRTAGPRTAHRPRDGPRSGRSATATRQGRRAARWSESACPRSSGPCRDPCDSSAAVTLKRARRLTPQPTK